MPLLQIYISLPFKLFFKSMIFLFQRRDMLVYMLFLSKKSCHENTFFFKFQPFESARTLPPKKQGVLTLFCLHWLLAGRDLQWPFLGKKETFAPDLHKYPWVN